MDKLIKDIELIISEFCSHHAYLIAESDFDLGRLNGRDDVCLCLLRALGRYRARALRSKRPCEVSSDEWRRLSSIIKSIK